MMVFSTFTRRSGIDFARDRTRLIDKHLFTLADVCAKGKGNIGSVGNTSIAVLFGSGWGQGGQGTEHCANGRKQ